MRVLRFPARRWRLLAVPVALAGLLAAFAPAAASAAACVRVTAVPPPAAGGSVTELDGVTTASSCVAWAVGSSFGAGGVSRGVIEHYDGTGWSVAYVSAGSVPGESRALSAVTAISPTNVWAVGTAGGQMLILHFDGS